MKKDELIEAIETIITEINDTIIVAKGKMFVPEDLTIFKVKDLKASYDWLVILQETVREYKRFRSYLPEEAWNNYSYLKLHRTPEVLTLEEYKKQIRKICRSRTVIFCEKFNKALRRKNEKAKTKNR